MTSKPVLAATTIACNNYLAFARVFAESYLEHHPGAPVFVCVPDEPHPAVDYASFPFETIFARDLGIPNFRSLAFRYDILEFSTAVKPYLVEHLLSRRGLDRVAYFDPDIRVYDRLGEIETATGEHDLALTPHICRPLDNEYRPSERQLRMAGIYNLGFAAFRRSEATFRFLRWWGERLSRFCRLDPFHGVFVDQSWADFAPAFLDEVAILREPRLNVAYWNLPHRPLSRSRGSWSVEGKKLGFFHFSGIDFADLGAVSRHQTRLEESDLGSAIELFRDYRERVLAAGHEQLRHVPYAYERFSTGGPRIPRLVRRLQLRTDPLGTRWDDPFDREGADSFFAWLTEPVRAPLGTLNRAALAIWEDQPETVARFPNPLHADLVEFARWLVDGGGAAAAGVGREYLGGVTTGSRDVGLLPYIQSPMRPFSLQTRPERPNGLAAVDLANPGPFLAELAAPFPGARGLRPCLTNLAVWLWEDREELQSKFPDLFGRDREPFVRWLALEGALGSGLHPELVRPIWKSLSLRSWWALYRRPFGVPGKPNPGDGGPATATPEGAPEVAPEPAADPVRVAARKPDGLGGVNVIAHLSSDSIDATLARGTLAALAAPTADSPEPVAIDLDIDLWGSAIDGLVQLPGGAPHPILIAHVGMRLAPWLLGWLPSAATAGGYRIGYLAWDYETFPPSYRIWLHHFDELWVPCRAAREAIAEVSDNPVERVPPVVAVPDAPPISRAELGVDPEAMLFYATFDARDLAQRENPWGVLAAFREAIRGPARPRAALVLHVRGLPLDPNIATPEAELSLALAEAAAGLPVVIWKRSLPRAAATALLTASDAVLALPRADGVALAQTQGALYGLPVVSSATGAALDLWPDGKGWLVPGDRRPIGRNAGRLPGQTEWLEPRIDAAAAAIRELIDRREEAAERARGDVPRLRAIHEPGAAHDRLAAALDGSRRRAASARS